MYKELKNFTNLDDDMYKEFEGIISFDNMYKALKKSCRNVRWKDSVIGYESNGLVNTQKLIIELKNGKYKIKPYKVMTIYEPKERIIYCTNIRDRQVQHCICDNYLYDEITKSFIYDNFACQYGKGNHKFIKRLTQHLVQYYNENNKSNKGFALTTDIQNYFNSIPHDVAKIAVNKRVKNIYINQIVFNIIDSYEGEIGLYAGGQVIQLVALAVLDDLDHFIKEKLHIKHYMRYNDDFILIHQDKEYLQYCKIQIEKELNKIGLTLKKNKTKIVPLSKGFKILHWRFILKENGKVLRYMEKKKITKYKHKVSKLIQKEKDGLIDKAKIDESIRNFNEYTKQGNTTFYTRQKIKFYISKKRSE